MRSRADPWQAAGFLGMGLKTLEKNYGHHHPDHFDSVHKSFYKHRSRQWNANECRESTANNPWRKTAKT
jgi:hypothetical protein